jgi:hypothetical protein
MAARPAELAEKHLQQQIQRQIGILQRKQVPKNDIEREVRAMESAVRAELWRQVLCPPHPSEGA